MTDWLCQESAGQRSRFVLWTFGANPLVCVGVNPSPTVPNDLDRTVSRLTDLAEARGFDSWVMLNLYPQRSTDPKGLMRIHEPKLKAENERHIANFIGGRQLTLLGARCGLMTRRPYPRTVLAGTFQITDATGCDWVSCGKSLAGGHPQYLSCVARDLTLHPFSEASAGLPGIHQGGAEHEHDHQRHGDADACDDDGRERRLTSV